MFRRTFLLAVILSPLSEVVESQVTPISRDLDSALVDPTRPLGYVTSSKSDGPLRLQAIFIGGERNKAIINGVALSPGDRIEGRRVVAIKENEVVFDYSGHISVLKLRPKLLDQ